MPEITTSLRIPNYAGAPGSPLKGHIYLDTGTNLFNYYNGTAWVGLGAAGNVSNSGTPTVDQLAIWVTATTIKGLTALPAANFPALTGDITTTAGSLATTIASNAVTTSKILDANVTYAKIQNVTATSRFLGRITTGAGVIEELTSTDAKTLLAMNFSDLSGNWTLAQGPSGTAGTLLGRGTSGVGPPQEITLGSGLTMTGTSLAVSAGGGNVSNTGTPTSGQYARWTSASVIEGVSTATVKTDIAVNKSDVGLGSVTNDVQTKAAIVPNTAPGAGQILVGNSGATAYAPVTLTGATLSNTGALSAIPNATLSNSAITIAGTSVSLGTSITLNTIMGVTVTTVGLNFLDLANPGAITFPKIDATNNVIAESAATYRTSLGATTAGGNIFTLTNPSAISYPRIDATNAVTAASAATIKTDLSLSNVTNDAQIKASDFPASSVDSEISLFSGTTGKAQKRATGSGIATVASGVLGTTPDNHTNWDTAFTNTLRWDGGSTSLVAATGRASLGIGDAKVYVNSSAAAAQTGFATDQYLTGSTITIPAGAWVTGGQYKCIFDISKTAVGTATPIVTVRLGTAGTTSDTTGTLTLTFLAPSAAGAETVTLEVFVTFRSVGSGTSAVVVGTARAIKNVLSTAGFSSVQNCAPNVSSGFNSTTPTKIGVSFNGGASFAGTVQMVQAEYKQ